MKKRSWLVLLAILLVLIIASIFAWPYLHPSKGESILRPHVSITRVNITGIGSDTIRLTSRLVLANPLPVEIRTNDLYFDVFVDSASIVSSSYKKPLSIRSGDSSMIEVPVEIAVKPLAAVLKLFDRQNRDSANYSVRAHYTLDVPVAGEKTMSFNFTKRLPAIRIPVITGFDTDIHKLGLSNSRLDATIAIYNPNSFAMKMKDGVADVAIDETMKLEATFAKVIDIPAKGSRSVPAHLEIKTPKLGKLVWKALFDKKDTHVAVHFRCRAISDNHLLDNTKLDLVLKGTLQELLDLGKTIDPKAANGSSSQK